MDIRDFKNGDKIMRTKPDEFGKTDLIGNCITFYSLNNEYDYWKRLDQWWICCDIYGTPFPTPSLDLRWYDDDGWDYFDPNTEIFKEIENRVYKDDLDGILRLVRDKIENRSTKFIKDLKEILCKELDMKL